MHLSLCSSACYQGNAATGEPHRTLCICIGVLLQYTTVSLLALNVFASGRRLRLPACCMVKKPFIHSRSVCFSYDSSQCPRGTCSSSSRSVCLSDDHHLHFRRGEDVKLLVFPRRRSKRLKKTLAIYAWVLSIQQDDIPFRASTRSTSFQVVRATSCSLLSFHMAY